MKNDISSKIATEIQLITGCFFEPAEKAASLLTENRSSLVSADRYSIPTEIPNFSSENDYKLWRSIFTPEAVSTIKDNLECSEETAMVVLHRLARTQLI